MSRPDHTRRRRLLALVCAAFLLGFVASPAASSQEAPADGAAAGTGADVDQFGGFIASSRSNGLQVTYDSPGLLPTGSPTIQLSVPEALATLSSGPVGYALSSFAYPGPLLADLNSALAASGTETGLPGYPIRAEAFFPSGPTETTEGGQGSEMTARTEFADSMAHSSFVGVGVPPAGSVGAITARSQSLIEGDQLVSRTRTAVSDVSLLAGLIRIDSVITDVVATSNGSKSASAGGTTVSGLTVLGLPATIDAEGIRFDDPPAPEGEPDPVSEAVGGLVGDALDPVADGLGEVVGPLNDLLEEIGAAGDDALEQLFEASGIEIEVFDAAESVDGGSVSRIAPGLSVTIHYDGSDTPVLTDLLALIPTEDLPSENLGPVPFSPQALAKLLEKQHIQGFAVAPAAVRAEATPAFEFVPDDIDISTPLPSGSSGGGGTTGGGTGGDFETATPELPAPAERQPVQATPTSTERPFPLGDAIPALIALGVLMGSPFFAAGSRRLADNTLAAVGSACPEGLDLPTEESGS